MKKKAVIPKNRLARQAGDEEMKKRAAELILAQVKAEEGENLKTAFLQNISHEIRTPLNGIIGFSELLSEDGITQDDIKKYSAIICQNGNRLIEIVNNILDISKIQTGQISIEKKPLLIHSIFASLLASFQMQAEIKKIKLFKFRMSFLSRMSIGEVNKSHKF